jgi:chromosome segregation ATPase
MRWLFLVMAITLPFAASAKMYKWVDEQGRVHYGDTIPPQYSQEGNQQLNKEGIVIKKTGKAPTPEQLKEQQAQQEKAKEEKNKEIAQQRRDKALRDTYTTVEEIDQAKDRNLKQVELDIKSTELRMQYVQGRLDKLKQQEANFTKRNKPVPADIASDIANTNQEIARMKDNIVQLNSNKAAINTRFDSDKKRFMELTGKTPAAPAVIPLAPPAITTPAPLPKK